MRPPPPLLPRRRMQPMDEPLWTFEEISAATGAPLPASGSAGGVSIDSRTLQPGDLFVAIKGERADGHKFVEAAFERGAAAAIVEAGTGESPLTLSLSPWERGRLLNGHSRTPSPIRIRLRMRTL